jgi:hypothetical protein
MTARMTSTWTTDPAAGRATRPRSHSTMKMTAMSRTVTPASQRTAAGHDGAVISPEERQASSRPRLFRDDHVVIRLTVSGTRLVASRIRSSA